MIAIRRGRRVVGAAFLLVAMAATTGCDPRGVDLAGASSPAGHKPKPGSTSTTSAPASASETGTASGTTTSTTSTTDVATTEPTDTPSSGSTTEPTSSTAPSTTPGATTTAGSTTPSPTTSTPTSSTPASTTTPPATGGTGAGGLGAGAALLTLPFPTDNAWNTRVDGSPIDPNSATLISSIGSTTKLHADFGANWNGGPFGIPYVVVPGTQKKVPVSFDYADESDPGPYPIPANAPIEGGANAAGDRHVIVVDRDNRKLYELFDAHLLSGGGWHAGSGAVFDLSSNALRPAGWTSADAAGLPILPGLVRYDEVASGHIDHALRFTVVRSRKGYVAPARHFASSDTSTALPPMGMRVRLKASFDVSGYPAQARVVLTALKTYGMIVADNGSNWYMSGAPDSRWNDEQLNSLKQVPGSAFEVVAMGPVTTN